MPAGLAGIHNSRIIVTSDTFRRKRSDELYLDRGAERQCGDSDRAAGAAAGFTEDLGQQPARSIHHAGLSGEAGSARDETHHLHDAAIASSPPGPATEATAASALIPQIRARSAASSGSTRSPGPPLGR